MAKDKFQGIGAQLMSGWQHYIIWAVEGMFWSQLRSLIHYSYLQMFGNVWTFQEDCRVAI